MINRAHFSSLRERERKKNTYGGACYPGVVVIWFNGWGDKGIYKASLAYAIVHVFEA